MRAIRDTAVARTLSSVLPPVTAVVAAVGVARWALTEGSLIDTAAFREAARAVVHGQSPYAISSVVPFVYPPAGVLATLPTLVGPNVRVAATVWLGLSLVALARTVWLLVGLAWPALEPGRRRRRACWVLAAACLLEPTLITLSFGQVGLVLLWLTVEGLRGQPGRTVRPWLVGVAAAIKLTPAVVLVGLAAAGRWRSASWGAVGFVGACVAAAALAPAAVRDYVGGAWRLASDVNATPDALNHSLIGVVRLVGLPPWAGLVAAAAALVLGVALTARIWRDGDELAGLATVLVTGLLASPVSWGHHWVAVYPALVLLLREARAQRVAAVVLLSTAVVGMLLRFDDAGLDGSRVLPHGLTWALLQREWSVAWAVAFLCWAAATRTGRTAVVTRGGPATTDDQRTPSASRA